MTKYHKRHRIIATFFLLIFFPTLLPSNLFASTNGPVAPEATSFEPVDATDMVNLATGDLSYVMPLLDVPSPEGGYPITLSYHAGIAIDQDASWVGLGWSLNPGTINRSISGFPDDWKQEKLSSFVFDSGGEVSSHNFSVGVGWGSGKFSAGLYGSYSENKAFGGQNSYNFDGGAYGGIGNIQGRIGSDGVGIGISNKFKVANENYSISGNYSVGISHSFKTGKTSLSVSASAKMNSTGMSTATNSNGSVGISSVNYTSTGSGSQGSSYSMLQVGDKVGISINAYVFQINYSFSKIRYNLLDTKSQSGIGTLYAGNISTAKNNAIFEHSVGFDTYTANYDQTDESIFRNNIVLPTYDFYSVSAQGISGDISPKIFEYGTLTPKSETVDIKGKRFINQYYNKNSFSRNLSSNNIYFYFNNTNESYLNIDSDVWGVTPSSMTSIFEGFNSPLSSLNSSITINGENYNGYNSTNNRKKGSSYIETYTNQQIITNPNLTFTVSNFNRNSPSIPKDGIGAFKITTADGKTYHYTIPVYQKEKFARSAKYDEDINNKFYEEFQLAPYATHWLLTAITGSDFVDNGDGIITDKDLGYWVTFDYGKWSDGYTWRTPRGSDFKTTPTSKMYEWGIKEIYYLNAVKTRTHTAFFVKSERSDGKSIPETIDREYSKYGYAMSFSTFNGKDNLYYLSALGDIPGMSLYGSSDASHKVYMNCKKEIHTLLKLDKIITIKNKDIPANFKYTNPNETPSKIKSSVYITESVAVGHEGVVDYENKNAIIHDYVWSGEHYNNVLDSKDFSYYFPNIEDYSTKIIDFNYDYNLAIGTPNGINSTLGRLTLNKLVYRGKKGVQVMPPYVFQYENPSKAYINSNSDDWGYNKEDIASWNLNKIIHPNGANILIKYEEDDYYTEAANYDTKFKNGLKFTFSEYLGKLRITAENSDPNNANNVKFSSYYKIGQKAKVDIWACLKHEYNDGGCKDRDGNINIDNESVDVVGVSDTGVTFETSLSGHTTNERDGLNWLYDTQFTYEMDRLQSRERYIYPDLSGGCSSRTAFTLYYAINSSKVNNDENGGGLRVKQITVNADGKNYNTNYYYNQDGFSQNKDDINYKSSGITSYSPSKFEKNIKYMAELPPPGVIYGTVKVETDENINKYYFKTLNPENETSLEYSIGDILNIKKIQNLDNIPITISNFNNPTVSKYKYEVKNNFSMIGALIKQESYNKLNQLLRKVENNYAPTSNIKQGLIKETFNSYKNSWNYNKGISKYEGSFDVNVSSKILYPAILQSVKISENNSINITSYDKFDFITGQILETSTISSDGQSYKSKVIPAYLKYNEMGSKVDNINYKNMLSQTAVNYSYIWNKSSSKWQETGVGITTWNNIWTYKDIAGTSTTIPASSASKQKVWRKHKTYTWNGVKDLNGIFINYDSLNGDDNFNWNIGVGSQPSQWKQISEVTLYDHFSLPLETKDINGNYSSTKMGDNETKIMITGNAGYSEMFYSGGENITGTENIISTGTNWLEPEVNMIDAKRNSTFSHTGKKSIEATNTSKFGVQLGDLINGIPQHRSGKYKVSVWVEKTNAVKARINNNGTIIDFKESYSAGNWVLKSAYVDVPIGKYYIYITSLDTSTVHLDDLMIRPVASTITGYVYNEWDELSFIIANNGLATKFEYDAGGRLIKTFTEVIDDSANGVTGGFKVIKSNTYNNKYLN